MSENRCFQCMDILEESVSVCPRCGHPCGNRQPAEAYHLAPGTILRDRYLMGLAIGFGGFGVTYIAYDYKLQRKVAIKEYLPNDFSTRIPGQQTVTVFSGEKEEQFLSGREKFLEEAQRLANCQNAPNIVEVYDTFELNKTAYICMEYLEGKTLREYLKEKGEKLSFEEAMQIMLPVLDGLSVVHQNGIIHRDVSPDNIFLTADGGVRLLDFGAARYATTSYSKSLSVILKPGYAPEEQYRSHGQQGPWSDVYACGATMYRMITGKVPEDALERKAEDHLKSPRKLGAKISKSADNAIMNALNINIENRTQSARALADQLQGTVEAVRIREKLERELTRALPTKMRIYFGTTGILTVAAVAVCALLIFIGNVVINDRNPTIQNVPDVVNKSQEEAESIAQSKGIPLSVVSGDYHQEIQKDIIISQNPEAGSAVQTGTVLTVSKSYGPKLDSIPLCTDRMSEFVVSQLEEKGFQVEVHREKSDSVLKGAVISQSQPVDSLFRIGGTVIVTVSDGTETPWPEEERNVPAVEGMPFDEAKAALLQNHFYALRSEKMEYSTTIPRNQVIRQPIAPGTKAAANSAVELVVSLGVEQRVIPNVQYKTEAEAQEALEAEKMRFRVADRQEHDTIAEGCVISQTPEAGVLTDIETEVSVVVSLGKRSVLPDLTGKTEDKAIKELEIAEFLVHQSVQEWHDTIPKGQIIRQLPTYTGERINVLTEVSLVVSKGLEQIEIPNVTGMTISEAEAYLTKDGKLKVVRKEEHQVDVGIDAVFQQSVPPGAIVDKYSTITLTYSPGVDVPNVIGATLEEAASQLQNAGFGYSSKEKESSDQPIGRVFEQAPESGQKVAYGESISFAVSRGVQVPSVVGADYQQAEATLKGKGLAVSLQKGTPGSGGVNQVTSQSISAGQWVNPRSVISIVYCPGVNMPQVAGRSFNDAQEALSAAGIQCEVDWEHSESVAWGTVMSQSVPQGTLLDPDAEVMLTVSMGTAGKYIKGAESSAYPASQYLKVDAARYKLTTREETSQNSDSNTPPTMSGWNYLYTDETWGPWSDWQGTDPPRGDNLDVKQETTSAQTLVGYNVVHYLTRWPGNINRQYLSYYPEGHDPVYGVFHRTGYVSKEDYDNAQRLYPGEYFYGNDAQGYNADSQVAIIGRFGGPGVATPWFVTGEVYEDVLTVKYLIRTKEYTHYYERWTEGNWSDWGPTADVPAETQDQRVETETGYWVEGIPG